MIGSKIGNFQIIEQLGAGGMGTVYKARDLNLKRFVAIKVLNAALLQNDTNYKRFKNEAEVSAQINHPNVATMYNYLEIEGKSYIVMEFVDGITLEDLLDKKGKLSKRESVDIVTQILKGLSAAHQRNILHRDLKPANIMVSKNGFVKIMDFGIALMENATRLTTHNKVIGTINYMAPELLTGTLPSPASDLYAVGVLFYEMLTGKVLFHAESEPSLMYKIVHERPQFEFKDSQHDLKSLIAKMVHKKPEKRFMDTASVLQAIQNNLGKESINAKKGIQSLKALYLNFAGQIGKKGKEVSSQLKFKAPKFQLRKPAIAKFFELLNKRFLILCLVASTVIILIISSGVGMNKNHEQISDLPEDSSTDYSYQPSSNNEITSPKYSSYEVDRSQPKQNPDRSFANITPEEVVKETSTPKGQEEEKTEKTSPLEPKNNETIKPSRSRDVAKGESDNNKDKKEKSPPVEEVEFKEKVEEERLPVFIKEERAPEKVEEKKADIGNEKNSELISLTLRSQKISIIFPMNISSNNFDVGDAIFLKTNEAIKVKGHIVVAAGAPVKATVLRKKSSNNGKLKFGLEFNAVQAVNGEWLDLKYPEYTDIQDEEVVFEKGRVVSRVTVLAKNLDIQI